RRSGKAVRTYSGHEGNVRGFAFSPDSRRIVSASDDRSIRLWSVDSERELTTFHGHASQVTSVAFAPDGYQIATGSTDQTVKIWFSSLTTQVIYQGHDAWIFAAAFSPDGRAVVTGSTYTSDGGFLSSWDPATGEVIQPFPEALDY